jgi:hypothetical protein
VFSTGDGARQQYSRQFLMPSFFFGEGGEAMRYDAGAREELHLFCERMNACEQTKSIRINKLEIKEDCSERSIRIEEVTFSSLFSRFLLSTYPMSCHHPFSPLPPTDATA